jgi:hypothetical protein
LPSVEHGHFFGDDVDGDYFVVLGQQHGITQAYVAGTGYCDFHVVLG